MGESLARRGRDGFDDPLVPPGRDVRDRLVPINDGPVGLSSGAAERSIFRATGPIAASTFVRDGDRLRVEWPMEDERGQLVLDFAAGRPLVASLAVGGKDGGSFRRLLEGADPVCFLLVGSRQAPEGRPPEMSVFNVFFDSPANRPYDSYRARLDLKRVRVASSGRVGHDLDRRSLGRPVHRASCGFKVYRGARLIHVETVIHTERGSPRHPL